LIAFPLSILLSKLVIIDDPRSDNFLDKN